MEIISQEIRGLDPEQIAQSDAMNLASMRSGRIDSKHRIPVKDNFFQPFELLHVKNELYKTKEEEFIGAQIFTQDNSYMAGARQVGYDLMEPTGQARIGATGGAANDIPFSGERLKELTQPAVEIEIGIKYTRNEIEAADMVNAQGRGANLKLITERGDAARRAISRTFDKGIFQGYAEFGLKGLQTIIPGARQSSLPTDNNTVHYEAVPDTGTGSGDAKRLWANKTGILIYKDLLRGKRNAVEKGKIFNGDTLIVDSEAMTYLMQPYSDLNNQTLINYITQGNAGAKPLFKNVFETNAVSKANNGRNNTYFVICDSSAMVAEIPILRPITVFPSKEDWNGEIKQLVALRYAGLIIRYKAAFYFGDSHIETLA